MYEICIIIFCVGLIIYLFCSETNKVNKPCHKKKYLDDFYLDMPLPHKLYFPEQKSKKSKKKSVGNLNDLVTTLQDERVTSNIGDDSNPMKTMWSVESDLHEYNDVGSPEFSNTDIEVIPTDIHHQLKNSNNENVVHNSGQQNVITEGFADDTWLDEYDWQNKMNEDLQQRGDSNFYTN